MNRVRVMIRAKVGGKYPYLPAVVNGNGRIKPGVALGSAAASGKSKEATTCALPKAAIAAGSP
jgi:hypothetical protein